MHTRTGDRAAARAYTAARPDRLRPDDPLGFGAQDPQPRPEPMLRIAMFATSAWNRRPDRKTLSPVSATDTPDRKAPTPGRQPMTRPLPAAA